MSGYFLQYPDHNAGPAFFQYQTKDHLLVTKIFRTIQGEGPFAGCPATFIRLAGCNRGAKVGMGCEFCDTDFRTENGKLMSFDDIVIELNKCGSHTNSLVVISGGEPMIQNQLVPFIEYCEDSFHFQIESNGDRLARGWDMSEAVVEHTLVVSPKVTRSGYLKLSPDILRSTNYLKFLVDHRQESPYYDIPEYSKTKRTFLSPITVYKRKVEPGEVASIWDDTLIDREATYRNHKRAAEIALREGFLLGSSRCFRVSTQMHLALGFE